MIKYSYLLNDVKDRIEKKEELKNNKTKSLNEIAKLEKELLNINKPSILPIFKKNDEKHLFNYNKILEELTEKYEILDNAYFDDIVATKLQSDTTVLEALKLISTHYLYFTEKTLKTTGKDMDIINHEYNELKEDVSSKEFNMINSIALLDRKHMKEIISNKYKLEGMTIDPEYLQEENIENTMEDINSIIRYEDICNSSISLDDIDLYLKLDEINNGN